MSLKNTYRNVFQNLGKDSTSDWYVALSLFALGLCLMFVVNLFFFFTFGMASTEKTEASNTHSITLKQDQMDTAVSNLTQKEELVKPIPAVVRIDPSL